MERFLAAWRFLTVVPVPGRRGQGEEALAGSLPFFPVVGLLVGAVAAGGWWGLSRLLPPLPAAVLGAAGLLAVSGGLHMDGLADTADGFFSSRPRERVLEIMRDSRVGAMGAIAVILLLMLKVAALGSLPAKTGWEAFLLMPLAGRAAIVGQMALCPYARPSGGLGTVFYRSDPAGAAALSWGLLLAVSWLASGVAGLWASGAAAASVLVFSGICREKIGGATGDTLGAGCELAEAAVALAFVAKPLAVLLG